MESKRMDKWRLTAAALVPPIFGAGIVYLAAVSFQEYGWTLFVVAPVIMGFVSAMIYAPNSSRAFWKCYAVSLFYIGLISAIVMAVAIEGFICVIMSLPIVLPMTLLGASIGYVVRNHLFRPRIGILSSIFLALSLPFMLAFEAFDKSEPTLHKVISTVEIDAPIDIVWKNIIEFPQIESQPDGVLRLGFAYPINARIDGTGIGAIRYCNFNTGPFVEPITAWDAPNRLAFDVTEQPSPMTELSPYDHLQAAHLDYIRSQKGEFRLYEKDGKTIVEGTTYYFHDIAPDIYWNIFSDEIIHQIHLRVLNHIKRVSEDGL